MRAKFTTKIPDYLYIIEDYNTINNHFIRRCGSSEPRVTMPKAAPRHPQQRQKFKLHNITTAIEFK
jgi:hypothetical protein